MFALFHVFARFRRLPGFLVFAFVRFSGLRGVRAFRVVAGARRVFVGNMRPSSHLQLPSFLLASLLAW